MICGALQTLNEEAFEDVVCSERPSPSPTSGGPPGELVVEQQQLPQLASIRETAEWDAHHRHPAATSGVGFGAPNGGSMLHDHHHSYTQSNANANANAKNANHGQRQQQSCVLNMDDHRGSGVGIAEATNGGDALPTVIVMPSNTTDDTPL